MGIDQTNVHVQRGDGRQSIRQRLVRLGLWQQHQQSILTAPELASLRRSLKASFQSNATEQDKSTFTSLFLCWTHNAVATFALCLLAQAYHISASLIQKFADADVTVGFLMQIDKLVQLLEPPHCITKSLSTHTLVFLLSTERRRIWWPRSLPPPFPP